MNKYFSLSLLSLIFIIPISAQTNAETGIKSKFIKYDEERIKLSLQYLRERHGLIQENPYIKPTFIVLHYTAGGTLQSNYNYFNRTKIEDARTFNKDQSQLNVSSHYIVDRNGDIYCLIPDTLFARHTIGLNYCSIGIENIGSKSEPLTKAQVDANAKLVRHLCSLHKIKFLIGHSEYGKFRNSIYWKETNPKYFTGKEDPGSEFMKKVRALVADLNLKNAP